ncbi:MAG: ATP-binding cassette domain-containing protein [Acidobacteriota bacterium]
MCRLEEVSGVHIPTLLSGTRQFLGAVNSWISQGDSPSLQETVVLLPDPTANLSFPYPSDELMLAIAASDGAAATDEDLKSLAGQFNISLELLERPITALSGGERMLISLAKVFALSKRAERLCLCSPYFWLDTHNRQLVDERFGRIESVGDARLLLLGGEDDDRKSLLQYREQKQLTWHLDIHSPSVLFPAKSFPRVTEPKQISFISDQPLMRFQSPTLLTGRNGVGKTTLAKLLAQLIQPDTGSVQVITRGLGGSARLLLQDTVVHLFGDSVQDHIGRVFSFDHELWKEARKLYESLECKCLERISEDLPGVMVADRNRYESMLQCKLAVVVDRLLGAPPLLILDEPGWCLSETIGRAFVETVVSEAHERGIAVLIISHQAKWWDGLVSDELVLEQEDRDIVRLLFGVKRATDHK